MIKVEEVKNRSEKDIQIAIYYPSTLRIHFRLYSRLKICPSLHCQSSNPLRYRRLLLLSIQLTTYANILSMDFCLACFFQDAFLASTHNVQINSLSMVQAACLRIVKACEDRSAVNYSAQVQLEFVLTYT